MIDAMQRRTVAPFTPLRRIGAPVAALVVLLAALTTALLAPVAGAHGDDGVLQVVSVAPSGTSTTVTVRLTYQGDGHPVDGATVTIVGDDGAGAAIDPVQMTAGSEPGQYTATIEFPSAGVWNLRVTSVSPAATLTVTHEVTADPGVTAPEPTDDPVLDEEMTSSPTTADVGEASSEERAGTDDGDGSSPLPWILGGLVVIVCVGLGVVFVLRGRNQGPID
jgi:hypothetical protein